MKPAITILIPVYNQERFVGKAIESVLSQSFADLQIVVSDNASTDRTRDVVRSFCGDKRLVMIENARNGGFVANANRCLEQVRTPYYMMLCSDDILFHKEALALAFAIMESHPEVPSVYCDLAYIDEEDRIVAVRRFGRSGLADSRSIAMQCFKTTRNWFGIPLLIRTSSMRGQCYDQTICYTSDIDLSIAICREAPIYHIPDLLIGNRYHGANETVRYAPMARRYMLMTAAKHGVHLIPIEVAWMTVHFALTLIEKRLFFIYLALRRRWRERRTASTP
ncbi:MAG: glycosyltransferase [Verrucomicrobia bacterium]|nr:glycosyltransferase [Verrucomicrobiota bacterium]MBU4428260.1 glycosyltransferase [Verrucomicrobiota bacterium]MCG2679559.1 glycosyltransferase [Kiritimatiellia bacterium]